MNADQVTRRQARMIEGRVVPMRAYMFALKDRMAKRGFTPGDPLFDLVANAAQALGELYVDLEYRRKVGPVDLPPRPEVNHKTRRELRDKRAER
jgi:hypothetical protein